MYMQFIAKMIPTYKQMYQQVYDQQINLSILRYIDNEISYAISGKKVKFCNKNPDVCILMGESHWKLAREYRRGFIPYGILAVLWDSENVYCRLCFVVSYIYCWN